ELAVGDDVLADSPEIDIQAPVLQIDGIPSPDGRSLHPDLQVRDVLIQEPGGVGKKLHDASPVPRPDRVSYPVERIVDGALAIKAPLKSRRIIVHPSPVGEEVEVHHFDLSFPRADLPERPDFL